MDALSDVLRVVRLTGGVFLDAKFTAPWSVAGRVEPEEIRGFVERPCHVIGFHYVVAGRMVARVAGCDPVEVKAGEIVLLTRNDTHILASALEISPISAGAIVGEGAGIGTLEYGGGGAETRMVCGYLGSDCLDNPVVASLPPMLTLNVAATPGGAWIAQSFAFAAQQLAEGAVGASTIISKLSELMFVEAVRRHIEHLPPEQTGWLAGLRDPAVGKALALLHTEPSRDWTAEGLADAVHLSRSAFAERFTALLGQPPMKYLTGWRMQLAAHRLRENRGTVAQIAFDVGYESEASFTRAFRREMGAPPATWRKQAAPADHTAVMRTAAGEAEVRTASSSA
jgi:AraC-like DNA-binding protein